MNLFRWFPALTPRRSFESVLRELIDGLRDGSIVLDRAEVPDSAQTKAGFLVEPTSTNSPEGDSKLKPTIGH